MIKKSLIVILITIHINAFTQQKFAIPFSRFYTDNATLTIGIQYNYVYQNYQIGLKNNWQKHDGFDYPIDNINHLGDLKSISSKAGSGFAVGIPIDLKMNSHLYLNISPSFLFVNNLAIAYQSTDISREPLIRKSKHDLATTVGDNFKAFEIPLALKLRSAKKGGIHKTNQYSAYIISGLRYSRWIGINKAYKDMIKNNHALTDPLILKPGYLSWEVGIGADLYFEGFKVSPEIKFNQSFKNVLDTKNPLSISNKFMNPIESSLIRNLYLGLIFYLYVNSFNYRSKFGNWRCMC
mgnify:CR=1 FL=1